MLQLSLADLGTGGAQELLQLEAVLSSYAGCWAGRGQKQQKAVCTCYACFIPTLKVSPTGRGLQLHITLIFIMVELQHGLVASATPPFLKSCICLCLYR